MRATIPTTVGSLTLAPEELSEVMSGLTVDDAIISLGKERGDASIAGGSSTRGELGIIAVAIKGISGQTLAEAIAANWLAMTPIQVVAIGDKAVQVLAGPVAERAYVYYRGSVAYVVSTADARLAAAAFEALP